MVVARHTHGRLLGELLLLAAEVAKCLGLYVLFYHLALEPKLVQHLVPFDDLPFAVGASLLPVALVYLRLAIEPPVLALFVLSVSPLVSFAVGPRKHALAMHFPLFPLSLVRPPVTPDIFTPSLELIVHKRP